MSSTVMAEPSVILEGFKCTRLSQDLTESCLSVPRSHIGCCVAQTIALLFSWMSCSFARTASIYQMHGPTTGSAILAYVEFCHFHWWVPFGSQLLPVYLGIIPVKYISLHHSTCGLNKYLQMKHEKITIIAFQFWISNGALSKTIHGVLW